MYAFIRSILFILPPETAHNLSLRLFRFSLAIPFAKTLIRWIFRPKSLPITCFGLQFDNPVGLAAGFDKNAHYVDLIQTLSFGYIEIGSVTNQPWSGNAKPRLFRIKEDQGIINRMGLNNEGADAVSSKLSSLNRRVPLFINIAKTPDKSMTESETIRDYCESVRKLKDQADVVVLNISCPNADGGRTFEDPELLSSLLTGVRAVLNDGEKPLLVKVSPDLTPEQIAQTIQVCEDFNIDGYTATNTTINRANLVTSNNRLEVIGAGGMSGKPLHKKSVDMVRQIRTLTEKPIVGVGGVFDRNTAQDFMDAGASLVQVYSGFIYQGPSIVQRICDGLTLEIEAVRDQRSSVPSQ